MHKRQMPGTCFAGRIIIRKNRIGGLDWEQPCPIPPEQVVPLDPPWYFCVKHHAVMIDVLWRLLDAQGLIDHDVVAGPPDEFDLLVTRLEERQAALERVDPDVEGLRGPGQ